MKYKNVLVTGANGFIGSHLTEYLNDKGYNVSAFCHYNSLNSWGWLESLPIKKLKNIKIITGDIRDPNGVRNALRGVDVVYHLAALIAIPYSYLAPDSYIDTNIKGTLNVLQAARDFNLKRVLATSTSEVYGTARYIPIDENHPRQPQSPYSASKIGADSLAESFYRSFELPVTIVRPFNTYGPRQSARAVIPSIIIQLLDGNKEIKLGALKPTRDLLFVEDTVAAFHAIAQCNDLIGHDCNIATQKEVTIGELAEALIQQINPDAKIVCDNERLRPENSEVFRLCGAAGKIQKYTAWKPKYTLKEGLSKTIAWFRSENILDKYKAQIYNI